MIKQVYKIIERIKNELIVSDVDYLRKVIETFSTKILLIIIGTGLSIIIARTLGPEGRGQYTTAAAFVAIIVQFGNLGIQASNTYYVAKDKTIFRYLLGNSILVSGIVSLIVLIGIIIILNIRATLIPITGTFLSIAVITIPISIANLLFQNLLIGLQDIRSYNLIELITKLIGIVVTVMIVLMNLITAEAIYSVSLVTAIISFVWLLIKLLSHSKLIKRSERLLAFSISIFRNSFAYGIKAYLANFFAFLVFRADILMIKNFLGDAAVGLYSISVSMADLIYMLPVTIASILFPKLAAVNNTEDKWKVCKKTAKHTVYIMVFICAVGAIFAKPAVTILYGNAFEPAIPSFLILLPGIFAMSITSIISSFNASIGFPISVVILYLITSIINIVLNSYLIQLFGINGAALSSTLCYIISFCGVYIIAKKLRNVNLV